MCDRDREVVLKAGDFHVVPRGVEHRPRAAEKAWVMFVEPAETKHTGDVVSEFARSVAQQIAHLT
jgi:mannose-6-phosphate isomerase-like protein (cupin superfamily)